MVPADFVYIVRKKTIGEGSAIASREACEPTIEKQDLNTLDTVDVVRDAGRSPADGLPMGSELALDYQQYAPRDVGSQLG
jgi:hypothetical protein